MTFKRTLRWTLVALVLLGLALAVVRVQHKRQQALAPAAAPAAGAELAPTDLITLAPQAMDLGLPLSGTLKAVDSAVVKARVAGELQGLSVREGDPVKEAEGRAVADTPPLVEAVAHWDGVALGHCERLAEGLPVAPPLAVGAAHAVAEAVAQ